MPDPLKDAATAAAELAGRTGRTNHDIAVVLGSGLGAFADALEDPVALDAHELTGFPRPTVVGHAGRVVAGQLRGCRVLVFAGRCHLYEGHTPATVVHPVRTAAAAGARTIVLTNAAGSLNERLAVGRLVAISDHLNLTGANPLTGPGGGAPAFVDLIDAYAPRLRSLARRIDPGLDEGVYAGLAGPSYETPAEIRMLARAGADLVGMSTVLETIAARQARTEVAAFSLVTNRAAGMGGALSHEEVTAVGAASARDVVRFLSEFVPVAAGAAEVDR